MRIKDRSVRRTAGITLAAVLVAASPLAFAPPSASVTYVDRSFTNPILTWNRHAEHVIWDVARQTPLHQARGQALLHGAIYDAVNAIAGTPYQPYLVAPRANGSESTDAAVATAAYRVLDSMLPEQHDWLLARYNESLAAIPRSRAKQRGIEIGAQAATAMINSRVNDGAFGPETFPVGDEPGEWRPTPPNFINYGAWTAFMKPFLLPSASMFRTSGPPALTSAQYARDYNEVKAIGSVNSTTRTADQTQSAIWWSDLHLTEWEIKRQVATNQRLNTLRMARMFAMVNLAEADAYVACFDEKITWNFWRPVTAIQLGDTDGNPDTVADPSWMPLVVTPPHPDYTSGHACYTGASMSALRYFFGKDNISFSAYSSDANARRYFSSFSQAINEVIEARIWAGIHTRTADEAGAVIGQRTTAYMTQNYFRRRR